MRALSLAPGVRNSTRLEEVPEPSHDSGAVLVQTHAVGICGTDREIVDGRYGEAPPRQARLVLGHEAIGRVLDAPNDGELRRGDWVVPIVRRPDPVPCPNCAIGEWDMCRNGRYTEHGIKGLHGFASERFRAEPPFLIKLSAELGALGVLLEPASVVAKAWEHIERIGARARFEPERALVTGAGTIGLLAALFAVQRGLSVQVLDRVGEGPKRQLVEDLGATYHTGPVEALCREADVVLECTGASTVIFATIAALRADGIACLTGVSSGGHVIPIDVGELNRELVLENSVVFGSVNANRRHYAQAADALARADRRWLERLVTRWVPVETWQQALERDPKGVKSVLLFEPSV